VRPGRDMLGSMTMTTGEHLSKVFAGVGKPLLLRYGRESTENHRTLLQSRISATSKYLPRTLDMTTHCQLSQDRTPVSGL